MANATNNGNLEEIRSWANGDRKDRARSYGLRWDENIRKTPAPREFL